MFFHFREDKSKLQKQISKFFILIVTVEFNIHVKPNGDDRALSRQMACVDYQS